MRAVLAAALVALSAPVAAAGAKAQTITELEPLSFGNFVVRSNTTIGTVTVPQDGSPSASPEIILLTMGSKGLYRITGLRAGMEVGLDVIASPLLATPVPSSQYFNITAVDHPAILKIEGDGATTFSLGATLSTSGTGLAYTDTTYSGTLDITVLLP